MFAHLLKHTHTYRQSSVITQKYGYVCLLFLRSCTTLVEQTKLRLRENGTWKEEGKARRRESSMHFSLILCCLRVEWERSFVHIALLRSRSLSLNVRFTKKMGKFEIIISDYYMFHWFNRIELKFNSNFSFSTKRKTISYMSYVMPLKASIETAKLIHAHTYMHRLCG